LFKPLWIVIVFVMSQIERLIDAVSGAVKKCRRDAKRKIVGEATERYAYFLALSTPDSSTKKRISCQVRLLIHQLARSFKHEATMNSALVIVFLVNLLFALLSPYLLSVKELSIPEGYGDPFQQFIGWHLASCVALFVVIWIPRRFILYIVLRPKTRAVLKEVWYYVVFLGELGIIFLVISRQLIVGQTYAPIVVGMVSWVVFTLGLVLIYSPIQLFTTFFFRRQRSIQHPDAVVVYWMLRMVYSIERNPARWQEISFKNNLMYALEEIARCVERDLPNVLQTRDVEHQVWFQHRTKAISASLRSLKKWICLPRADTREKFLAHISSQFIHSAQGHWDNLSCEDPQTASASSRLSKLLRYVRIGIGAVLPLSVLWLVQKLALPLEPSTAQYATIGAIIWFILSVVFAVDPFVGQKIGAFRELMQAFPGESKAKGS
jgi:hypothetical protein